MRVEQRNGTNERRILIGLLVNTGVLGRVSSAWSKEGLFKSKWSNLIAGWAVSFYEKYGAAPGQQIEGLFHSWAEHGRDPETVKLVESFLGQLSGEYAQHKKATNTEYLIDLAGQHFNQVRIDKFIVSLQGDVQTGDITKAQSRIESFGQVEMGSGAGIDVLGDQAAIQEAFADKEEPLIRYKGALGNFFRDALERDAFIAFMGPEKRGKTWWLMDIAWRGMLQRRKVAFFSVGDMSQNQMMRRFQIRAARHPLVAKTIKFPTHITLEPGESIASVDHKERVFDTGLSWQVGNAASLAVQGKLKTKDTLLKLSCHPNSSISVQGIMSILQSWSRSGWDPDVIVIDYADILMPPPGIAESRDGTNATWKKLRALSQSLHCLVVTATQADAASYRAETIDMMNFSEDKRKLAHVTGMVGLNSTPAEKDLDLMRLNWIVLRESEFSITKCVHVAGCRDIGNPAVLSTF